MRAHLVANEASPVALKAEAHPFALERHERSGQGYGHVRQPGRHISRARVPAQLTPVQAGQAGANTWGEGTWAQGQTGAPK